MNYRFTLPAEVENQVYDCALYITQDSPTRALAWVDDVLAEMRSICELPYAHTVDERLSHLI